MSETAIPVRHPVWTLSLAGANVTAELMPFVLNVTYTDHLRGSADEVSVTLDDPDGRFRGDWYPRKGDALTLTIGYAREQAVPCGRFEVDEVSLSAPPGRATLKAVSAPVGKSLRTTESRAYENITLDGLVRQVAGRQGLAVVGTIDPIPLRRITQSDETDLAFLTRVSDEYGHIFSVRGDQLVFSKLADLRAASATLTLRPTDIARWSFKDKTDQVYSAAEISYHDPVTKTLLTHREPAAGGSSAARSGDTLKLKTRCESLAQAKAKAAAALADKNRGERSVNLALEGAPGLVAGVTVGLAGFGNAVDGSYLIETSTHTIGSNSGYTTELELKMGGGDDGGK